MTERAIRARLSRLPAPDPLDRDREPLIARRSPVQGWDLPLLGVIVAVALVGGGVAAAAPLVAAGGIGVAVVVGGVLALGSRSRMLALTSLAVALVGYGFLSRGFSYIGARPVFIGEVLLLVCVIATIMALGRARFRVVHAVLLAFMVLGAARTIPYLGTYGIDAARDGATWIYAFFAFAVSILVRPEDILRVVRAYGWYVPLFVAWVPLSTALTSAGVVPTVPGTDVPIIGFKMGDMGVQLAGVAGFVLSGTFATTPAAHRVRESVFWMGWLVAAGIVAAQNRGAMVAMAAVAAVALVVRPSGRWARAGAIALGLVVVLALVNPTVAIGDRRALSFNQLVDNATSVFGSTGNSDLDGSRGWRLRWWSTIIAYTVDGPYFWTGKGFGINLADADGFQVGAVGTDQSLRAPHNGHMEILAREGVPGFVLWVLLQATWLGMMLRSGWRARRRAGGAVWVGIAGWLVVYWAASLVNMSFDVFLQGPHGGIWFWSVFGLGIAVAAIVDRLGQGSADTGATTPAARPRRLPATRAVSPVTKGEWIADGG